MENYIKSLEWRYATKKYDSADKVSPEDIESLKTAVRLTPSSVGLQPYKVIVIEDKAMREKLVEGVSGNNKAVVADASHVFVFAIEENVGKKQIDKYMETISEIRNTPLDSLQGFHDYISNYLAGFTAEQRNNWSAKQAFIALGNLMSAAALLKIDTTPMEGFDPNAVNEILGLEKLGLSAAVIAAAGYRHEEDAAQHSKKVRKPNNELFITI
ncbi:MAG: NAD(P)H-dependent oxidoreductase [Flavobacterium sp.]|nr:MAG: NAD(P)H-dependent oxidoreductase [Flavobacterium sp.]